VSATPPTNPPIILAQYIILLDTNNKRNDWKGRIKVWKNVDEKKTVSFSVKFCGDVNERSVYVT
jgi:hypothetical protein